MKRAPSLSYFCRSVKLPDVGYSIPSQNSPSLLVPYVPDHISYGDVTMEFKVDINFQNWQEIFNWMRGVSDPSGDGIVYTELEKADKTSAYGLFSDVSLIQLDSQNNPLIFWDFHRCFPLSLSGPQFTAKDDDVNYITSQVTFKLTNFSIAIAPQANVT